MTSLFETLRDRAHKRARYNETVAELSATSLDTRLDLDIYSGDIQDIARKAVYGKESPDKLSIATRAGLRLPFLFATKGLRYAVCASQL